MPAVQCSAVISVPSRRAIHACRSIRLVCAGQRTGRAAGRLVSARAGIAAVRARLETGTLKVVAGACPNLLAEAALYHYDAEAGAPSETPLKEHDHALDALRYLISRLDARPMARLRNKPHSKDAAPPSAMPITTQPSAARKWLSLKNESL